MAKRNSKMGKKEKKSKGLSQVKMRLISAYKLAKSGKLKKIKKKEKKDKLKEKKITYNELQKKNKETAEKLKFLGLDEEVFPLTKEMSAEEMMEMMDADDIDYLVQISRQRNAGKKENNENDPKDQNNKITEFENIGRNFDAGEGQFRHLLPIKTSDGFIERVTDHADEDSGVQEDGGSELEYNFAQELIEEEKEENLMKKRKKFKKRGKPDLSVVDLYITRHKKLEEKKVKIGCYAVNFIQDPNERLTSLSGLIREFTEPDPEIAITIRKYAALSLLEVFLNVLPGYKTSPHDLSQKYKKATKVLYYYENKLMDGYKVYLIELEKMVNEFKQDINSKVLKQQALIALKCLGELLQSHPAFNFSVNIIHVLVPILNHTCDELRTSATKALKEVLRQDLTGSISLEIVQKVDSVVRSNAFLVKPDMINVLLSLKLMDVKNKDSAKIDALNKKRKLTHTEKLIRKLAEKKKKMPSKQQSRDLRRLAKAESKLRGEVREVEKKTLSSYHTDIIHLVFGLYVHVLKRKANGSLVRAVLEGLAKFSHLINVEFFSDLLKLLSELLEDSSLKHKEGLHCIQAVFKILSGQEETLSIEPRKFYCFMYKALTGISAGHSHPEIVSALNSCHDMLITRRKRISIARVLAFTKRLTTLSLALLHYGAVPTLIAVRNLILSHPCTEALLDPDSEGTSGLFNSELEEPDHSNAAATAIWELHLLKRHYHPVMHQISQHLLIGAPMTGDGTLPSSLARKSSEELYNFFDATEMRFVPAVVGPSKHLTNKTTKQAKMSVRKRKFDSGAEYLSFYMNKEAKDVMASERLTAVEIQKSDTNVKKIKLEDDDVDFSAGMLSNINLENIPSRIFMKDFDITIELMKVRAEN